MGAIKEHSNQIIKILICLCLTFVFIFVQPKENVQQAQAIAPLLLWGGSLLLSVVAEEALEMGLRHYTNDGSTKAKSKTKKIADEIFGDMDSYGFDFLKSNPKRLADGSLEVNMSANDRAKIARKIADEFGDVLEGSSRSHDDDIQDVQISHEALATDNASSLLALELADFLFYYTDTYASDGISNLQMRTDYGQSLEFQVSNLPNTYVNKFNRWDDKGPGLNSDLFFTTYKNGVSHTSRTYTIYDQTRTDFLNYRASNLIGKGVARYGGLMIPRSLDDVYPAPPNMSPTYKLPNYDDLSNKPHRVPNVFDSSSSDTDVTWEVVNEKYEADEINFVSKIDNSVNTKIENEGDETNYYDTEIINNNYTDSNYPIKSGDVTVIVENDITVPTVPSDTDIDVDGFKYCVDKSTGKVVPCKDIEAIDGGLLAYLSNSYNYAVNAVKTAVNGLETIATGSVGLIALYSEIFDWLPDEVTVLLTSGLMLMIGLRVFRK